MGLNPYSSFNEIINAMKLALTDRRLIALFLFSIPLIFLLYYYLFTSTALGYLYLGRLYIPALLHNYLVQRLRGWSRDH
ncbi:MAG: hypothetical protein RXO28_06100 [Thermocladium sp.]